MPEFKGHLSTASLLGKRPARGRGSMSNDPLEPVAITVSLGACLGTFRFHNIGRRNLSD